MRAARACGFSGLLLLVLGVAACGGSSPSAATSSPSQTASAPATATASTPASAPSHAAGAAAPKSGKIPDYHPSTVVSHTATATVLRSSASVSAAAAFYRRALRQGGWQTVSESASAYHASFVVRRPGTGASVTISKNGTGSTISISTYPR